MCEIKYLPTFFKNMLRHSQWQASNSKPWELGMAICINWTYDCPKWFHDINSINVSFFLNVVCLIPVSFVHFFSKCSCLLGWEFLFREIATVHGGSNLALHATKKTLDLGQNVQFSIPCNKKHLIFLKMFAIALSTSLPHSPLELDPGWICLTSEPFVI